MGIKGQKVHPIGWRVGVHRKWKHNWFQENKNYTKFLLLNLNIEKLIESILYYNQKNILILKYRNIGFIYNQLFLEINYFKKILRNKKKKKKRLFNLINFKKENKYDNIKYLKIIKKNLKYNNLKILNKNIKKKFLVYFFYNSLWSLNKNPLIPSIFNNINKINNNNNIWKINKNLELIQNNINNLIINKLNIKKINNIKKIILLKLKNKSSNIVYNRKKNIQKKKLFNSFTMKILRKFFIYNFFFKYLNIIYTNIIFQNQNYNKLKLFFNINNNNDKNKFFSIRKNIFLKKSIIIKKTRNRILKNFIFRKIKLKNSLNILKKNINILSGYNINLILINSLSFTRFNKRNIFLKEKSLLNIWDKLKLQRKWYLFKNHFLIKSLERFFKYRYPGVYMGNLIYTIYFGLFLKNPYIIVKMLGLVIKELPKNSRQVPFIRTLLKMIARISGSFQHIEGLKIQFKGRFDRWNRTKSILFTSRKNIPRQTFSIFLEYGATQGLIKKGTYSIRLWIYYNPTFIIEYKDFFEKYWQYSKYINKIK